MRAAGKILIVGASSGIGRECARIFCLKGWRVGAIARREEKLREIRQEFPDRVKIATADITSPECTSVILRLIGDLGGVDIIFLTAGVGWSNPSLDMAKDLMTVDVNVKGFVRIVDTAYNYFKNNNPEGQIAAVSSVAGVRGIGISASYSASKSFDSTYLEALAQLARIERLPLTVTDIKPGFVRTDLLDNSRNYPLLMNVREAAALIADAIICRKKVAVINRKWAILVFLWRLLPHSLWRHLRINL